MATREWQTWKNMMVRCYDSEHRDYPRYGGRGIVVCASWQTWPPFKKDMGLKPPGATLERRDVNAAYSPENCCWATRKEQQRNRRNNVLFYGKTAWEWAELHGFVGSTLYGRFKRGWTLEAALSTPARKYGTK